MTDPMRDARVERTHRLLFDAVLDLVRETGQAPTVSALCKRAGLSRPTFYQYFETPDEVLAAAVRERFTGMDREVDMSGDSAPEVVRDVIRRIAQDPRLFRSMITASGRHPQARQAMEDLLATRMIAVVAPAGTAWGELSDEVRLRLRFAAGGFVSAIGQWLDAWIDGRTDAPEDFAELLWQVLRRNLVD